MKAKKYIAMVMAVIFCMQLIPTEIGANLQKPLAPNGIVNTQITHKKIGQGDTAIIEPSAQVQWNKPPNNDPGDPADGNGPNGNHTLKNYQFMLKNVGNGTSVKSNLIEETKTIAKIEDYILGKEDFVNGALYELEIIPIHNHLIIGNPDRWEEERPTANNPKEYFITDFDTKLRDNNGKLEISWEYIPGATYNITYIEGDKKTKKEILDANEKTVPLDDDYAKKNKKSEDGVERVYYTIPDAMQGQLYSAFVEVSNLINPNVPVRFTQIKKNDAMDNRGPKIVQATTLMNLRVFNIGDKKIRLEWDTAGWLALGNQLITTTIWEKKESDSSYKQIGQINNAALGNEDAGFFEYKESNEKAFYRVDFKIKPRNSENTIIISTKETLHTPYELREKPQAPRVPEPFSKSKLPTLTDITKRPYLVKNDMIKVESPLFIEHTFHGKIGKEQIVQLVWDAPTTKDEFGKEVVEYQMGYDIWIAESKAQLTSEKPTTTVMISEGKEDGLIYNDNKTAVLGFKTVLKEYTDKLGKNIPLVSNKSYYIKIIAKRPYGIDDYEKSEPTIVAITLDQNGDIFAPPVIGKPPLKLGEVTQNTLAIDWLEKWNEIMIKNEDLYANLPEDLEKGKEWNSKIYETTTPPAIRFVDNGTKPTILTDKMLDNVKKKVNAMQGGNADFYKDSYSDRGVTLGTDVKYEMKVVEHAKLLEAIENDNTGMTLEKWIATKENNFENKDGWNAITPNSKKDLEDSALIWKTHTIENLKPTTRYVVMLRAYRILEDGTTQAQAYPSYVIGTTLSDHQPPEEIPTAPNLVYHGHDDVSIAVKWQYNNSFDYEIRYSKQGNEDPEKGTVWPFEISEDPASELYVKDGSIAIQTITGLFPDTTYHIWIRAKQKKGDKQSEWSNPVTQKTDTVKAPAPPTGLGPASYQSILELGLDFPAIAKDYITVEWIKNPNDIENTEENTKVSKEYQYVVEFADNVEFLDAIEVVVKDEGSKGEGDAAKDVEILAKNMVKFNKLIANMPYYVRVKTRLIVKDTDLAKEIVKESEFTKWVRIFTKKSDDEYDGGENENIVIYPDAIKEDYVNGVWTWEVVDAQTIISKMIDKKGYFFEVKLEKYMRQYDATTRKVRLPKPLVDAMIGQKIELRIVTNKAIYEIPSVALSYYVKKGNAQDVLELEFKSILESDIASIVKGYPYQIKAAESMQIALYSKKVYTTPMLQLDGYMEVKMKLSTPEDYLYSNTLPYTYDRQTGSWIKENYRIENADNQSYMVYPTARLGIYSTYTINNYAPIAEKTPEIATLLSNFNIEKLGINYKGVDKVSSDAYINLLLGIAENRGTITLDTPVAAATRKKAAASGIYTSSNTGLVTEEEAISGIVKLYEIKSGFKVKPSSVRFNTVSTSYRDNVSKAYALGLIETINPKGTVDYNQLAQWINQVAP